MILKKSIRGSLFFFYILCSTIFAQQKSQYTQYMYNTISINPAFAGSRNVSSIMGLYRTQWMGLEGAPKTVNIAMDLPMSEKVGIGLSIINDNIGPSSDNTIGFDVSYNIPISDKFQLYFGVEASINHLNIDFTKLNLYDPGDYQFQENVNNKFSPNIGVGFYLKSDKTYIGISAPRMLETLYYDHSQVAVANEKTHLYLMGGTVIDLSPDFKFKPGILLKAVPRAPIQVDVSSNFLFYDKFTFGFAYRVNGGSLSTIAGFQISKSLLIGLAYDTETSKLSNFNSGSSELFLRFDLINLRHKKSYSMF